MLRHVVTSPSGFFVSSFRWWFPNWFMVHQGGQAIILRTILTLYFSLTDDTVWVQRALWETVRLSTYVWATVSGNYCHQHLQLSIQRAPIPYGICGIFTLVFLFPLGSEWAEMTEESPNSFSSRTRLRKLQPCFCILISRSFNVKAWKQTKWFICLCQADCCCMGTFVSETSQFLMVDAAFRVR